jgi:hypothetical protein
MDEEGAAECKDCPMGTFADKVGSAACTLCLKSQYADLTGMETCMQCPGGRITNEPGSTTLDDCNSPEYNFYNGFAVSGFMLPFAFEYVLCGRYHRVAFVRYVRIVKKLLGDCKRIIGYLGEYVSRAEAERLRNYTNRTFKAFVFLVLSAILTCAATIFIFAANMSTVFFKVMILWKGMQINLPFARILSQAIKDLAGLFYFELFEDLFKPIQYLLDVFANLKIDFSVVNVTCDGALAPLQLLLNLCALGVVIVLIESDFQIFQSITFANVMEKFMEVVTQPTYRYWYTRDRGTLLASSLWGYCRYGMIVIFVLGARIFSEIDFFQTILQYTMTITVIGAFADRENNYLHGYSETCNVVSGFSGYDYMIALIASIQAYVLLMPLLYEMSKVLIPRLPEGVSFMKKRDKGRMHAKTQSPFSSPFTVTKVFTLVSPDVWLAVVCDKVITKLKSITPYVTVYFPLLSCFLLFSLYFHHRMHDTRLTILCPPISFQSINQHLLLLLPYRYDTSDYALSVTNAQLFSDKVLHRDLNRAIARKASARERSSLNLGMRSLWNAKRDKRRSSAGDKSLRKSGTSDDGDSSVSWNKNSSNRGSSTTGPNILEEIVEEEGDDDDEDEVPLPSVAVVDDLEARWQDAESKLPDKVKNERKAMIAFAAIKASIDAGDPSGGWDKFDVFTRSMSMVAKVTGAESAPCREVIEDIIVDLDDNMEKLKREGIRKSVSAAKRPGQPIKHVDKGSILKRIRDATSTSSTGSTEAEASEKEEEEGGGGDRDLSTKSGRAARLQALMEAAPHAMFLNVSCVQLADKAVAAVLSLDSTLLQKLMTTSHESGGSEGENPLEEPGMSDFLSGVAGIMEALGSDDDNDSTEPDPPAVDVAMEDIYAAPRPSAAFFPRFSMSRMPDSAPFSEKNQTAGKFNQSRFSVAPELAALSSSSSSSPGEAGSRQSVAFNSSRFSVRMSTAPGSRQSVSRHHKPESGARGEGLIDHGVELESRAGMYQEIELPSAPTFRVVSTAATTDDVTSFYICHKMIHNTTIWTPYPVTTGDYLLFAISRKSGLIDFFQSYDVGEKGESAEGRDAAELATDLGRIGREHIVVLFTNGSPGSLEARTADGLAEAVFRCGGSAEKFGDPDMHRDTAYLLIGIPDAAGEVVAYEAVYCDKEFDGLHSHVDVSFEMVADPVVGWNIIKSSMTEVNRALYKKVGRYLCFCIAGGLLVAPLRARTQVENRQWTDHLNCRLPGYFSLCKLEYEEMHEWWTGRFLDDNGDESLASTIIGIITFPLSVALCICWLGHVLTPVGRKAWGVVLWNYGAFFLICCGVWTDKIVAAVGVHESLINATVVYSQPKMRALPNSLTGDGNKRAMVSPMVDDTIYLGSDSDSSSDDDSDSSSDDSDGEDEESRQTSASRSKRKKGSFRVANVDGTEKVAGLSTASGACEGDGEEGIVAGVKSNRARTTTTLRLAMDSTFYEQAERLELLGNQSPGRGMTSGGGSSSSIVSVLSDRNTVGESDGQEAKLRATVAPLPNPPPGLTAITEDEYEYEDEDEGNYRSSLWFGSEATGDTSAGARASKAMEEGHGGSEASDSDMQKDIQFVGASKVGRKKRQAITGDMTWREQLVKAFKPEVYIRKDGGRAGEESAELARLDTVELKRKLKEDYAVCLYAVVATRACLLQLIPFLTPLSIFATTTSATPLFVLSKRLYLNLPELINFYAFHQAHYQEMQFVDECEYIKARELSINQHCLPNPTTHTDDYGFKEPVPERTRKKIHALNLVGRRKIECTRNEPPREVNRWIVAANGMIFFVTQSRGIMFLINLYRFILIIGILFGGEGSLSLWMASAVLILVPYSFVLAMNLIVILGKSMDIRDVDLRRLLALIKGCGYIRDARLRASTSTNASVSSAGKASGPSTYVFCITIVLPSFLVCDASVSLSGSISACLHSLT